LEFASIKGFKDILPQETPLWRRMEDGARAVFSSFGFLEIRTPILEFTELFSRGIGQETDIVSKEMYTLTDSKGRGMTLRPEATASVVRAYVQNGLHEAGGVQKLYTIGPMFRHERPQKGRLRQFHQINAELLGDPGPLSDADMIVMATQLLETMGLSGLSLCINSLGCPECRPSYRESLKGYLVGVKDLLCEDCRRRAELNPLRVFDCKVETCKGAVLKAPYIGESLCGGCRGHFEALKDFLDSCAIPYTIDPHLVRGLDYYCKTTFEIRTDRLGAQNAVAGGGRYDGLVKLLGGPDRPAIGFAVGMERVAALLEEISKPPSQSPMLFAAPLGDEAARRLFPIVALLRKKGCQVEMDYGGKGLKAQLKRADRLGARRVLIVGEEELKKGSAVLRDMEKKTQEEISLDGIIENAQRLCEV
jgi:histidyl-tRNA synthetase